MSIDSAAGEESRREKNIKTQSQIGIASLFPIRLHTRKSLEFFFGGLAVNIILLVVDCVWGSTLWIFEDVDQYGLGAVPKYGSKRVRTPISSTYKFK